MEQPKTNFKVVIICSLRSTKKERCEEISNYIHELVPGSIVVHPFLSQDDSLYNIQRRYISHISEADLILAIPKKFVPSGLACDNDLTIFKSSYGESSSYELALAEHLGKKVIFLKS